ncbi:MAG: hypothetical protein M0Z61_03225 [Nitrospiraceae bacterium]|nr:hypothetical protein [Nitrospiraceae bacterium]
MNEKFQKYKKFQVGFWHPFGPHNDESAEHILKRKADEIDKNGWTLWSFQYRREMLKKWYNIIKLIAPESVFVFCSDGNSRDPVENGSIAINCNSYRFVNTEHWTPMPSMIRVGHPFRTENGFASAFLVQRIIHPVNSFDAAAIEWFSKEGNWVQKRMSGEFRLPTRGEFLVRNRPKSICKMPRVRAVLELKPPYLAEVRSDKKNSGFVAVRKRFKQTQKEQIPQQRTDNTEYNPKNKKSIAHLMQPKEVITELKRLGYIARQNEQGANYWLNLGGPKSEINREDFGGLILLRPRENLIFGVSPKDVIEFREKTMERKGGAWKRREGVVGNADRVEVNFPNFNGSCVWVVSNTENGLIKLKGIATKLNFQDGTCAWEDVKNFLNQLSTLNKKCRK